MRAFPLPERATKLIGWRINSQKANSKPRFWRIFWHLEDDRFVHALIVGHVGADRPGVTRGRGCVAVIDESLIGFIVHRSPQDLGTPPLSHEIVAALLPRRSARERIDRFPKPGKQHSFSSGDRTFQGDPALPSDSKDHPSRRSSQQSLAAALRPNTRHGPRYIG